MSVENLVVMVQGDRRDQYLTAVPDNCMSNEFC